MRPYPALAAVLSAALVGCHVSSTPLPSTSSGRTITAEQIARSDAQTAWEVLRYSVVHFDMREGSRGRPASLRSSRGQSSIYATSSDVPALYVDGVRVLDLTTLQDLPARTIQRIRILNSLEAASLTGPYATGGAILIETRRGEDATPDSTSTPDTVEAVP